MMATKTRTVTTKITNATDVVLSDDQKQLIERVYGSGILQLNVMAMVYIIRALTLKGRTDSEASYYLQLLYISINDSILGALILVASSITTTTVHSATACKVVVYLLSTFNCTCQINMLLACIQRYMRAKESNMPTQSWKTLYTNRLAVINLLLGLSIFCVFLTFATMRDFGYSSELCISAEVATSTLGHIAMSIMTSAIFIGSLCASDVLLVLTFRSLKKQLCIHSEQSLSSLAQRKIAKTLAMMTFVYNISVLPVLIDIPLTMFIGVEDSNERIVFVTWFLYSNSLFSPLIVLTRATCIKRLVTNDARYIRSKIGELFQSCFRHNRVEHAETLDL